MPDEFKWGDDDAGDENGAEESDMVGGAIERGCRRWGRCRPWTSGVVV